METYQFRTSIPTSGIIILPKRIREDVILKDVVVTIKKKEACLVDERDIIDRLKGSFAGCLSTSGEFSKRKEEEKRLEL